ncbi:hypothetical protein [Aestuariivirga sp.]|uniref:hypothetical protein n=1 Tax=Aestuariivirga sp. TaxID=2650926 RepID=UPI0039E57FE0
MAERPSKAAASAAKADVKKQKPAAQDAPVVAKAGAPATARLPSYVPPPMFLNALVRRERGPNGRESVTMPVEAYRKLLAAAAAAVFDEADYLSRNDDVRALVEKGTLLSGLQHYVSDGYTERRASLKIPVDDPWYRKIYPDVAEQITAGQFKDSADHFTRSGFQEGRVPAEIYAGDIAEWREIVRKNGGTR